MAFRMSRRAFALFRICIFFWTSLASAANFPWEDAKLTDKDVEGSPSLAFGDALNPFSRQTHDVPRCRVAPGDAEWPTDSEWASFNESLTGALLKPVPAAAVCYNGANYNAERCNYLLREASRTRFYADNPLTVLTEWPEGNTCTASPRPVGNCTQGGFPVYVVNATTAKHIQLAVNFARNRNLRLVIKNTGHDFNGRSTGAGALSIWTHYLKSFEFLPRHKFGNYSGLAARVSAGIEAWELYNYMEVYNMTMVAPGGSTVGAYGGWMAGGGHSALTSYYGLGADQALSIEVVTADGRFVTASPDENSDLFYAMLGGGPSTYGVLTSAVVKAYPPIQVVTSTLSFALGASPFGVFGNGSFPANLTAPFNFTIPGNFTPPLNFTLPGAGFNATLPYNASTRGNFTRSPPAVNLGLNQTEIFWEGIKQYLFYAKKAVDARGVTWSYLSRSGGSGYSFSTSFEMPGMKPQQVFDFVAPLYKSLNELGIPVVNPPHPAISISYSFIARTGAGDSPGNVRFSSRLWPRANWDNTTIFNATFKSIRELVEGGNTFHSINLAPTTETAGYPGRTNAISSIWRDGIMHSTIFPALGGRGSGPQAMKAAHAKLETFMDTIRAVTPTGGSYVNEADVEEPNWQQAFYGSSYPRLLEIKKNRDPWGIFWAPTTPGSEAWSVITADGLPTQNGPLCQTDVGNNGSG